MLRARAQLCTRFMPVVRDAEAWTRAFARVDQTPTLPAGEIARFASDGWHRLEILTALCPKRTLSRRWRRGPINLRYRYHHGIEDAGIGPRITATDLHDPTCGRFKRESEREIVSEFVRLLAARYEQYASDESSNAWDLTVHPEQRPEWLVIAGTPGARVACTSRVHPQEADDDDGFVAGPSGERDSGHFQSIQRASEETADHIVEAFCSMRFNAQGPSKEAKELKACLKDQNIHFNIIDVKAGFNITKVVFETMVKCDAFVPMATKDYGECDPPSSMMVDHPI